MRDQFGREIRYLRISVTDRCNLRCVYCMPAEGVRTLPHDEIISYEGIAAVARAAAYLGFDKIRLTGGEPLVRRDLGELISLLAEIPGLRVHMTTNGTLLAPLAADLRARGLASVNISLDTLDGGRYRELTRGGRLRDALDGIGAARQAGLPVKLNVVMTGEQSLQDLQNIRCYAAGIGAAVQTIARYRLDERKRDGGEFDRPPPCSRCDKLRLLSDGSLRPCLHGETAVPVDFSDLAGSIAAAVYAKPGCGQACKAAAVSAIGG